MSWTKDRRNQVLAATAVFFAEIIMGLGYGWVAPTLRLLHQPANASLLHSHYPASHWNRTVPHPNLIVSTEAASWIASLCDLGRFIGPLIVSPLLSLIGRKGVLAVCSASFFCSWMIVAFTRSVGGLLLTRLIFGIAVGMNDVTSALYLVENFHPRFRGVFASIGTACFYGGCLVEYIWVNYLSYDIVAYVNVAISFLALSSVAVSTETAQYLITKKKYEKALKNFSWLQGEDADSERITAEFEKLKKNIDEEVAEERSIRGVLKTPFYRRLLALVVIFCVLMASTGPSVVQNFVSISFHTGTLSANEYTMLFGVLQFISAAASSSVIERVDRRTVLTTAYLIAAVAHGGTAILFLLKHIRVEIRYFAWWIFATITLYSMAYSSSILPTFYTFRGEVLPTHMRPVGNAIAILCHSMTGFVTTQVFLLVSEQRGIYWNFLFYFCASVASALYSHFILPETRGRSLVEIEDAMKKKHNVNQRNADDVADQPQQ